MKQEIYKAEPLDLVQSIYLDEFPPFLYGYAELDGFIDIPRLKRALNESAKIVPQGFCHYDYYRNAWVPAGHDADSVIKLTTDDEPESPIMWDLRKGPQYALNIRRHSDRDSVQMCTSHIMADGVGSMQYLYIVCTLYNGGKVDYFPPNLRSVTPRLRDMMRKVGSGHRPKNQGLELLPRDSDPKRYVSLKVTVPASDVAVIRANSKPLGLTLNDVFMAAYVQGIKTLTTAESLALPCPIDLRQVNTDEKVLQISNMAAKFTCHVSLLPEVGLIETAQSLHAEMDELKKDNAYLWGLSALHWWCSWVPPRLTRTFIRRGYAVQPISFTNGGSAGEGLSFDGVNITDCYMCSTYRPAPSLQVALTSYRGSFTLALNLYASERQVAIATQLLESTKAALLSALT